MDSSKITENHLSSCDSCGVVSFFVIQDGEIEEVRFFNSESNAEAAKAAWLYQWASDNEFDFVGVSIDVLLDAAVDDGYDIYIKFGVIEQFA